MSIALAPRPARSRAVSEGSARDVGSAGPRRSCSDTWPRAACAGSRAGRPVELRVVLEHARKQTRHVRWQRADEVVVVQLEANDDVVFVEDAIPVAELRFCSRAVSILPRGVEQLHEDLVCSLNQFLQELLLGYSRRGPPTFLPAFLCRPAASASLQIRNFLAPFCRPSMSLNSSMTCCTSSIFSINLQHDYPSFIFCDMLIEHRLVEQIAGVFLGLWIDRSGSR